MAKRLWITTGIIIALLVGFIWIADRGSSNAVGTGTKEGARSEHRIGNQGAKVTLVEYSDFQCPACRAYYPMVEEIVKKYQDRISFEYRHYPLATIHRNAFAAARASEAASQQGKFWEMYRLLFENQSEWADSDNTQTIFESYTKRLGLDGAKFRTDFASSQINSTINADIADFNRRGLAKATPTFLLNDKKIEARSADDFSKLIDEQLKLSAKR